MIKLERGWKTRPLANIYLGFFGKVSNEDIHSRLADEFYGSRLQRESPQDYTQLFDFEGCGDGYERVMRYSGTHRIVGGWHVLVHRRGCKLFVEVAEILRTFGEDKRCFNRTKTFDVRTKPFNFVNSWVEQQVRKVVAKLWKRRKRVERRLRAWKRLGLYTCKK